MSKGLKIIFAIFGFVVILIAGGLYYVSTKINPEEIRKIAISEIGKAMPGTDVKISSVDYSLGTSVKFFVKDFDLKLKKGKNNLFNVKNVEVNIPVLSILTGGGTIDVKILKPNMYYQQISLEKNNWALALPEKKEGSGVSQKIDQVDTTPSSETKIELPKFVEQSKINIKVEDIHLLYMPFDKPKSDIHLSKINLKNLNLKSTTAFEIASKINFALEKQKNFKTNLQIIGEVDLGKFLEDKMLESSVVMNITDTSLSGLAFNIPDVETRAKVQINPDGVLSSKVDLKIINLANAETNIILNNNKLELKGLNLQTKLADIKNILPKDLAESLKIIDFGNSSLSIAGSMKMNLNDSVIKPDLKIDIKDPLTVNPNRDLSVQTTLQGTLKDKDVSLSLVNNLFSGSVTLKVKTLFDPLNIPADLTQFNPIQVNLLATNLRLSKDYLQNTIYANETKSNTSTESTTTSGVDTVAATKIMLPPVNIDIEGKNIFIENQETNIEAKIKVNKDEIRSDRFSLNYGKGVLLLPFKVKIQDSQNILTNFEMTMKSISFESLVPLLPPIVSGVSGNFNGVAKGNVNLLKSGVKYNLNIDVNATNGELKDFNVKKIATTMFDGIKDKYPAKYEKLTNRFEKLEVLAKVDEKENRVQKFLFIGENKSIQMSLAGTVFMSNQISKLVGSISESTSSALLKSETGLSAIPIRITGSGVAIYNVDLGYSLKKLSEGAAKIALTKTKMKVNKQVNKKLDKAKKKLEEEAKKKLKNLIKF